ncbi:xanthine dehydrogenase family protein molybdopterin-binding subunit [Pseudomonas sp. W15Feb34]|uniref:xanthine dehydrogenase family protein molybdopterin-binding subunit n=1 Tax=Pseudomonas sp. W15Feb34 TaxID=550727 RepID=UPI002004B336|nr:xanthine dehydrogenase family protein molybdopterin-binding subunit [Pseudomonas sp. W15Feb34]MCK3846982.1 xanthine dehydrogenase family protein molybdopterin-binding subunit [Pseudomonas sp. W15Feb34]
MIRSIENQSRRRFLKGTAGLTLAMYLPWSVADGTSGKDRQGTFEPNAFLRIGEDNVVTVISKHLEMGQGAYTGLATLVAEELDADWAQVRVESAPAESRYNNSLLGMQGTGGSSSIANSWEQLRTAGATARAMLVSAAAWLWKVPAQEIEVADGVVRHPASGKQATLGQLAKLAGEQPVPAEVKLKEPGAFKLIGRQRLARKDSADKVNGKAIYTQDIHLPGMLTAVVAHAPRFGAKVKSFDARAALALPGVMHVVQVPSGVAVVAKDTWSAKKGRDALTVEWDESGAFKQSSGQMLERYRELAKTQGTIARDEGDVIAGLAGAARTLHAEYDFPFLAHSAMEPMNCVVSLTKDGCDTWHGAQMQSHVQKVLAQLFDLPPAQVRVHTLYAGGSFGRRASKDADYVLENAHIVKAIDGKAPVKLVWLREDDMQAGHYRPMYHHRLSAGLDEQGRLIAWQHRLVGQSVFAGSPFAAFIKDGIDSTSVEGGSTLPYRIPNLRVDLHTPDDIPIPIQWWRVVGHSHNAFSTECFFDELAQMAGQDPVAWRLAMLEGHSRHLETLKLVASKAGWDQPLAPGKQGERRGRGVALHEAFGSVVAQVAEVTVQRDGTFKVDRVVCAVECGIAVNPDVIRAQVEGSVGFALSAALREAITLTDGKVDQSNFHNNEPLRIYEMPEVLVHIVPSASVPSGIGEPPVAPLAPALVNALAAATGTRIRRLPIGDQLSV